MLQGDGYFSASHTENYYSTDNESIFHTKILHSSDSGADISEQNFIEKRLESIEKRNYKTDAIKECESNDASPTTDTSSKHCNLGRNNSLPELFANDEILSGWEKYWAKNGEALIWASWIERYSDYINPEYLPPKETTADSDELAAVASTTTAPSTSQDIQKSSKFSFEPHDVDMVSSRDNNNLKETAPATCSPARNIKAELMGEGWTPLSPLSIDESSYRNPKPATQTENDTLLSPRCESVTSSIPFTLDSMTNVTHMTISSYDFCSSRVSSESSISSVSSESSYSDTDDDGDEEEISKYDHPTIREDKTALLNPTEENALDVDQYWQMLWQKHFQEQYANTYQEFVNAHKLLQEEMSSSFHSETGGYLGKNMKSKGNKRRRGNRGRKRQESLQKMVANLNLVTKQGIFGQKYQQKTTLKTQESQKNQDKMKNSLKTQENGQVMDSDGKQKETQTKSEKNVPVSSGGDSENVLMNSLGLPTSFGRQMLSKRDNNDDDEKETRKNRSSNLKRTHESDPEESNLEKIKSNFEMMGFYFGDQDNTSGITSGDIVYRKKHVRLHNRMLKMNFQQNLKPKHIYFDEDGNEISDTTNEGEGVSAAHVIHSSSDEDIPPSVIPSRINSINFTQQLSSDANADESGKLEINLNSSIDQENESNCVEEPTNFDDDIPMTNAKKEKKKKRKSKFSSNIPAEIACDKSLKKFWYKRFSLFSKYDLGIKLDRGECLFYSDCNNIS